jgi:flagellar basal body-associated protein FliL
MRVVTLALLLTLSAAALASPAAAASTTGGDKKKGGGESFLQFPTLTAMVSRPGGRRGVLTVEAGLDVADEALRQRAAASTPRLRDAFVRYLTTYAATVPAGGPPNPDLISVGLQRSADQVLGKPGTRLLLGTIMIN